MACLDWKDVFIYRGSSHGWNVQRCTVVVTSKGGLIASLQGRVRSCITPARNVEKVLKHCCKVNPNCGPRELEYLKVLYLRDLGSLFSQQRLKKLTKVHVSTTVELYVVGIRGHMGHIDILVVAVRRLSRRWKVKTLLVFYWRAPALPALWRRRLPSPLFPTYVTRSAI